jgi:phosphoglucomutase
MSKQPYPEWLKTAFDQRFNELAKQAGDYNMQQIHKQKQDEVMERLKRELTYEQYQMILEWDDVMNYRNAVEKEWMYLAGIRDGVKMFKQIQDFMSG